ncbi:MAG: metallophosphoesterase [Anaerolineae bacterium]|nr:metallophosphoesterase [Anaerolineae bacterium]
MNILAVSDQVQPHLYSSHVRQTYPRLDLIVGCGDLPFYYLDFLVSALDTPLVYVRGNHDSVPQYTIDGRVLMDVPGGVDIHARVVRVNGLWLGGLEGSMRYRPGAPLMYTESEMRYEIARMVPRLLWNQIRYGRALDVLVTHSPPFDIHDRTDRAHTGFRIFHRFMRWFRPSVLLHGHVHLYRRDAPRVTRFEETIVINVYPYRLLDLRHPPVSDNRYR